MSRLRIFAEDKPSSPVLVTSDFAAIARELASVGVKLERWPTRALPAAASKEEVLAAYGVEIDAIVAERGFRTVDVVSVAPDHPAREEMRSKFLDEHVHAEDEVRFFVAGSGLFTLHVGERVLEILCEQGDFIGLPGGTKHWFDMGPAPSFVAIRFFLGPEGWVARFTGTDIAQRFPRFEPAT